MSGTALCICLGIHPTAISEAFQRAAQKSTEILESLVTPLDLADRESLLKSASTSLNSKVIFAIYLERKLHMPRTDHFFFFFICFSL